MFEVFNVYTGETVGYADTEWECWVRIRDEAVMDFICAEHNSTECDCWAANRYSKGII